MAPQLNGYIKDVGFKLYIGYCAQEYTSKYIGILANLRISTLYTVIITGYI